MVQRPNDRAGLFRSTELTAARRRACVLRFGALPSSPRGTLNMFGVRVLRLRLALRRGGFAGGGAQHESRQNPNRDLVEDDAGEQAQEKHGASGELVHGGSVARLALFAGGGERGQAIKSVCHSFGIAVLYR